jgi:hypothetical protein
VIPFNEALLQETCQSGLIAAVVGTIDGKKQKKDKGVKNSAVLFLAKQQNEFNVISRQFDLGLFPELDLGLFSEPQIFL